ncbi:MAG: type VI secretion system tube protein Hcp [Alphaproteobacteria bacterium]|nr:type VI secretion system tube protein Hcp [Alphaproteobacteria bacterium]
MPIYMKFEGIDGDVTAANHEKWIELHSVQWGSSRNVATTGEANHRTKSAVNVNEVVVTKDRCSASGKIWRAQLMNDAKTVTIDWVTTSQGGQTVYQSLKLTQALVSSFSQNAHADAAPLEQISFNMTEIELTAYTMAKEGTKASMPFVQSHNLSKG